MLTIGNEVSLYFHIPFCKRKCDYCHFFVLHDKEPLKDQLLGGFKLEWERLRSHLKHKRIATVYFGGGTPSLFGPSRIAYVLDLIHKESPLDPSAEITLEANPENITPELFQGYRAAGINRVSVGIQTLDSDLLHLLGRQHTPETALDSIHTVFKAGIDNISIDLMYDLPKQTLKHWKATLEEISRLPIKHLSLYNLTIEPHTAFFKKQAELRPWLPDEDISLAMYEMAIEKLEAMGLMQYEISAFAKPHYESKHNSGYWTGREFFGLGPSGFSYSEGKRFRNIAHLGKYCRALEEGNSPVDFEEMLEPDASRRELFVIRLRLREGVSMDEFTKFYGPLDALTRTTIDRLVEEGFLQNQQDRLTLTKKGILFYDTVAIELI